MASAITPTTFPRLDTSDSLRGTSDSSRFKRREFRYHSNADSAPRGKRALLQDYSRFVASFTGESEVCFRFALRSSLEADLPYETVEADVSESGAIGDNGEVVTEVALQIRPHVANDEHFDFGLELLADPDNFDTAHEAPILDCVR